MQLRLVVALGCMLLAASAQTAANLKVGDEGYGESEIPVLVDEINALWNKSPHP